MEPKPKSLLRSIALGLLAVGTVGTLFILYAVVQEYGFSFGDLLSSGYSDETSEEVMNHVVLPALIIVVPMVCAGFLVVWLAFIPLRRAAKQAERSLGLERGFRIPVADLPREVVPFARAVNALLERLDQSARQHEAFAANVAHELRDPLSILSLELDRFDADGAGHLKELVASMRRLVDQLMLLARIEAAKAAHLELEPQSLSEIASQAISQLAPAAISEGKSIELEEDGPAPSVPGHREALIAGVRNLIENALRATPAGGVVKVFVRPDPMIEVQDEGPGLDADRLKDLTKRFARADNASHEGAGLGLAIVDQIMMVHGGTLRTKFGDRKLCLDFASPRHDQ